MLRLELYRREGGKVVKWPPARHEDAVGKTDDEREADFERRRKHYEPWSGPDGKFALARFDGTDRTWL